MQWHEAWNDDRIPRYLEGLLVNEVCGLRAGMSKNFKKWIVKTKCFELLECQLLFSKVARMGLHIATTRQRWSFRSLSSYVQDPRSSVS